MNKHELFNKRIHENFSRVRGVELCRNHLFGTNKRKKIVYAKKHSAIFKQQRKYYHH